MLSQLTLTHRHGTGNTHKIPCLRRHAEEIQLGMRLVLAIEYLFPRKPEDGPAQYQREAPSETEIDPLMGGVHTHRRPQRCRAQAIPLKGAVRGVTYQPKNEQKTKHASRAMATKQLQVSAPIRDVYVSAEECAQAIEEALEAMDPPLEVFGGILELIAEFTKPYRKLSPLMAWIHCKRRDSLSLRLGLRLGFEFAFEFGFELEFGFEFEF